MKWNEMKSRGWEDERALLQYIWPCAGNSKLWRQHTRGHWQPLTVHLWASCTHPTHDGNDVKCEG